MDGWRDDGVSINQEVTRPRSYNYRRPPLGRGSNRQPSVPLWEKNFVASVGSITWKKFVERKKFVHLYDSIIKWNDSAGKEAFENSKKRFYANWHGLPCNKWWPGPDIYIDEIDWDSNVDPNLILDLESDSIDPCSKDAQVVDFGDNFPPSYQNFSPYGWGDSDDEKKKDSPEHKEGVGWGGVDDNNKGSGWNGDYGWGNDGRGDDGWGGHRNEDWGWNMYYGEVNNMSRYKTSRTRRDDNQRSYSRRNGSGNGNGNGNGRKSCASVNPTHRWSVKKPVS